MTSHGLTDQGGSGVRAIFDGWRRLVYIPPEIENHKAEKSFRLRLRKEKIVPDVVLPGARLSPSPSMESSTSCSVGAPCRPDSSRVAANFIAAIAYS